MISLAWVALPAFGRGSFEVTVWREGPLGDVDRVVDSGCGLGRPEYRATLAFGLLAAAALVAAIVAGMGPAGASLRLRNHRCGWPPIVRPIARRQMTHPPLVREGSYALVGKKAVVIEEVTGTQGLIKLSGEVVGACA